MLVKWRKCKEHYLAALRTTGFAFSSHYKSKQSADIGSEQRTTHSDWRVKAVEMLTRYAIRHQIIFFNGKVRVRIQQSLLFRTKPLSFYGCLAKKKKKVAISLWSSRQARGEVLVAIYSETCLKTTWEMETTCELRTATSVARSIHYTKWTWEIRPPQIQDSFFLTIPWVSLIPRFHCTCYRHSAVVHSVRPRPERYVVSYYLKTLGIKP